jgi:hypothetical protein
MKQSTTLDGAVGGPICPSGGPTIAARGALHCTRLRLDLLEPAIKGIRMLLNEYEIIKHGHQYIYLAGIDDALFFVLIILRRLFLEYRATSSRSFFRTRQKSIGRPLLPNSISY